MKARTIDMTRGPMARPLLLFILPMIGSSIFQQLYNTVDFMFVGNLMDSTAAAAVGASSTLITCTIGLFSGISVGTSVVAAQAIGAKDTERAERALHSSVLFGVFGGILVALLGMLFAPGILRLLRTPESVIPQAVTYLRIYILSVPMLVFYNMVSGGMRTYGDTRTPFLLLMICGFMNVAMDALFIIVIPLGVAGVSIATCITQSLSAVLVGIAASRPGRPLRLSVKKLHMDWGVLKSVLSIGLPTGAQTILITFSNVMVQYHINAFGETAVAAFATYYKVECLIYLPIVAFGQAATTFAGQNTGAKRFRRLRRGTVGIAAVAAVAVACIAGLILLFPQTVFAWFMKDREVVTTALRVAMISFPLYWIYPILEVFGGSVRGMGHALCSMTIIVLCLCGLRVGLLAVFSRTIHTIEAIAAVYPITWAVSAVSFVIAFFILLRKKLQTTPDEEAAS